MRSGTSSRKFACPARRALPPPAPLGLLPPTKPDCRRMRATTRDRRRRHPSAARVPEAAITWGRIAVGTRPVTRPVYKTPRRRLGRTETCRSPAQTLCSGGAHPEPAPPWGWAEIGKAPAEGRGRRVTGRHQPGRSAAAAATRRARPQGDGRVRDGNGSNLRTAAPPRRPFTTSQAEDFDRLGPLRSTPYGAST